MFWVFYFTVLITGHIALPRETCLRTWTVFIMVPPETSISVFPALSWVASRGKFPIHNWSQPRCMDYFFFLEWGGGELASPHNFQSRPVAALQRLMWACLGGFLNPWKPAWTVYHLTLNFYNILAHPHLSPTDLHGAHCAMAFPIASFALALYVQLLAWCAYNQGSRFYYFCLWLFSFEITILTPFSGDLHFRITFLEYPPFTLVTFDSPPSPRS